MSTISIATISRALTPTEETVLRSSLTALSRHGLSVFVTDGGSPESFVSWMKTLPGFTVLPTNRGGVFAQARQSVAAAAGSETSFIFYTEPDKQQLFESGLAPLLAKTQLDAAAGIVLAARSAAGFASFPAFQQMTETAINNCCAEVTGIKTDYCYGPFLFNQTIAASLAAVKEDIGWGWRPFVFCKAQRMGLKVEAVEDDFFCPPDQREDEAKERIYRMKQLEQNIRGIVLAANE